MTSNRLLSPTSDWDFLDDNKWFLISNWIPSLARYFFHTWFRVNKWIPCMLLFIRMLLHRWYRSIRFLSYWATFTFIYRLLPLSVKAACNMCERAVSWTHLTVIWLLFNIIVAYPAHVPSSFSSPFSLSKSPRVSANIDVAQFISCFLFGTIFPPRLMLSSRNKRWKSGENKFSSNRNCHFVVIMTDWWADFSQT